MDGPTNVENKRGAGGSAKSVVVDCFAISNLRKLIVVIDCDPCVVQKGKLLVQ